MINRNILQRLPKMELSYENILHKKVHADFLHDYPKG